MTTLVFPPTIADQLLGLLRLDVETGAVLLARRFVTPRGDSRLLATEIFPVPDSAYERRTAFELLISSSGYAPPLARAEERGAVPIWLHTHPGEGSSPMPSRHDLVVDQQLGPLFRFRANSPYYGSLILSPDRGSLAFSGHLEGESDRVMIDRIWCVGARLWLVREHPAGDADLHPIFDRNIRAFGGGVQRVLNSLHVAVVGCGGTGSAVAEQLVRLGVRHLVVVDPDELSDSNLTRVYGSTLADVGRPKVDVLADHLRAIAPDAHVERLNSKITLLPTARALTDADVIFGCTDDNAGRLVLSRLATYMLTPVIDCGVILTSDVAGRLDGIHGRVTVLYPGAACLVCRDRVDFARAASEGLTPAEHARRVGEGYAPALGGIEPAVVPFTTAVAAQAVAELLERLTGYGPTPVPNEVLLRMHEREISANLATPRERHYCHPSAGKLGLGETDPFLEQTWPSRIDAETG